MNRVTHAMIAAGVSLALCGMSQAGERGGTVPPPAPGAAWKTEQPDVKALTLVGKISKEEKRGKDGEIIVVYRLTTTDGIRVSLPGKKGETAARIEALVGQEVQITGEGVERELKGPRSIVLQKILSIQRVGVPAASPGSPSAPSVPATPPAKP